MNNVPLTNMAVSLSGGGYRATTFHLGALCLLDAIKLEAGNKLITDEKRRANGATLLENVRIISTISGGTLTGIMYALKLSQKGNFKDCYYKLYDLLKDDKLVDHALDKLNTPTTWKNKYKNRNLINSFAEVYNEHFYEGATFGDIYNDPDGHITDAIFGASEFTAGKQYRFQESGSGKFGSGDLTLPKEIAERIRLADAAASSSCFPGGFEPMTMPTDFSNGPESRLEEWWIKKKINYEREATIALALAEASRVEAAKAAEKDPATAASIAAILELAAGASKTAELTASKMIKAFKAAAKATADGKKASAVEKETALAKAAKATAKATKAKTSAEAAARAAGKATEEVNRIARQHPDLTQTLLKAQKFAADAEAAVEAARKAIVKATSKVSSAKRAAEKADSLAQEDRQKAELAQAATESALDLTAALKKAEKAATLAERSSGAANKAADRLAEACADLALILAEKVVETTSVTQMLFTAALTAEAKAPLLNSALSTAEKAKREAVASGAAAMASEAATAHASGQLKSCSSAVSLAEAASTKIANYKVYNPESSVYSRGIESAGGKAKSRDIKAAPQAIEPAPKAGPDPEEEKAKLHLAALAAVALRKAAAVSASEETEVAATATVTAAREAITALEEKSTALPKAITQAKNAATQAAAAAREAVEKSVVARNEKPHHPTTAIMDGGILDNQGIRGVVLAEDRYSNNGKAPPFIGTYIISDVSGKTMAPYTVPTFSHSKFSSFFTLKRINIIATVLLLGIVALLVFATNTPTWGVVVASSFLTILLLWFAIFLGIRAVFRARVSATFAGDELPEIMKDLKILVNTPLSTILHLMMFRATSAMKMITDIFLRRIRRLQIHHLFKSSTWNYRTVGNNIYELKEAEKLTPALKKVINAANNMPTTLWFSQTEKDEKALDNLIACGQLTLCRNLANYLRSLKKGHKKAFIWNEIEAHHEAIDAVLEVLEHYWQNFRVNPYWMIEQYAEERELHEEEREARLV